MTKQKAILNLNTCFTQVDTNFTEIKIITLPLAENNLLLGHITLMQEQAKNLRHKLHTAIVESEKYQE